MHASTTDPEAKFYRKGLGMKAKPCSIRHALMENRSVPIVNPRNGHAEPIAASAIIEPREDRLKAISAGAD